MKKILLLTTFSAMISQSLWGGVYQCQSSSIQVVHELDSYTLPLSVVRTLSGGDTYNGNVGRILVQGRCASNTGRNSDTLEINQLEYTASAIPVNCWCQIIYPYFSQFVYLPITLDAETASACMESCSRKCASEILSYGVIDVAKYPPSEIIYTIEEL